MSDHALCDHCATLKRLTSSGTIVLHFLKVPSYQRGTTRTRRVRRQCPGSNRPPRRVERDR